MIIFFIENLFVNTTAFSGKILNNDDFILELDNQIELLYNLLLKQFNYGLNISAVFYKDETYLTNDSKIKNTRNFLIIHLLDKQRKIWFFNFTK
ncbi:hypothetical protein [Mesomycoplasma neurolyticum]|uniref:Uncharacterized protein n=1 Tax=Mesomycoplasma neurolyticum TaxID=2120 RepID=A0A449A6W8_9BACT|nr:hypothetical protein [Mesomycoplasma neurolyticum]VEU59903.1 Uncharacterised protein [Mesomycoplasma neurolyticum]